MRRRRPPTGSSQARGGTHPDTGVAPTPEELTELEEADRAAAAALTEADRVLAEARANVGRTESAQRLAVTEAEVTLAEAREARQTRLDGSDIATFETALSTARSDLADARQDLAEARARAGAWVSQFEITFFDSVPRQVRTVLAEVGDIPVGPVMTITGAETIIDSGVATSDRPLVEVGAEALLTDADLGLSIEAVVTFVADEPGTGGVSEDRYLMRLEPVGEVPGGRPQRQPPDLDPHHLQRR